MDRRAEEEKMRREEERRKQTQIEERTKRPSVPEKKTVQLQTEVENDWFTFMGVSPNDYGMNHKTHRKLIFYNVGPSVTMSS